MRIVILLAVYCLIEVSGVNDALAFRLKKRSANTSTEQTAQTVEKNTNENSSSLRPRTNNTLRRNKTANSQSNSGLMQNNTAGTNDTAQSATNNTVAGKKLSFGQRIKNKFRRNKTADPQSNSESEQNNAAETNDMTQSATNNTVAGKKLSFGQRIKNKFRRNKTTDNQSSNNSEASKTNRDIVIQFDPQFESELQRLFSQSFATFSIDSMPRIMSAKERNIATAQQRLAAKGDAIMNALYAGDEFIQMFEKMGLCEQFFNKFLPKKEGSAEQPSAPEQPEQVEKPAVEEQTEEAEKPEEEEQPKEAEKPEEEAQLKEAEKPEEEAQPKEAEKPEEEEQPEKAEKPEEEEQPAETDKPAEGKQPSAEESPSEALVKTSTKLKGFDDWLIISELLKVLDDLDVLNKDKIRTVMQNGIQIGSCLLCKADNTLIYELADMPDYGICVTCLKKLQSGQSTANGEDVYDKAAKVLGVDRGKLSSLSKGELQAILQKIEAHTTSNGNSTTTDRTNTSPAKATSSETDKTTTTSKDAAESQKQAGDTPSTTLSAQTAGVAPAVGAAGVNATGTPSSSLQAAGTASAIGTTEVNAVGALVSAPQAAGITPAIGTTGVSTTGAPVSSLQAAGTAPAIGTTGVSTTGAPLSTPQAAGTAPAIGTTGVSTTGAPLSTPQAAGTAPAIGTTGVNATGIAATGNDQLVIGPTGALVPVSSLANTAAPYGYTRDASGNLVPATSLDSALLEAQQLQDASPTATKLNAFGQIAGAVSELAGQNSAASQVLNAAADASTLAAGGINLAQQMQGASTATQLNALGQVVNAASGLAGQNSQIGQALNTAAGVATLAGGVANVVQATKQVNQSATQYQNTTQDGNTSVTTSDAGKKAAFSNNTSATQQTSTSNTSGSGKTSKWAKFKNFFKRNK